MTHINEYRQPLGCRLLALLLMLPLMLAMAIPAPARKQQPADAATTADADSVAAVLLTGKKKSTALQHLVSSYSSWSSAEMSGRITSIKFFIKPSVKIFMKRGSQLLLSVRVPFKGEIARLEADRDSLLLVNKLNKTYMRESLETITRIADVTLTDVQDIFLGRLFIAGRGTLSKKDAKRVDLYSKGEEMLVVPTDQDGSLLHYGFSADPDGLVTLLMLSSLYDDTTARVDYTYKGKNKGQTLEFTFERKAKAHGFTVEFDGIKWGAKGFDRIGIPDSYTRLSPREFLNAVRKMKL